MEVLRDFAQSEPRNPPTRPSTLAPGALVPAAAASTRRILLSGLSSSNPLPPRTVKLLHGRLLRLDLLADLSHLLLRALSSSGLHLHALSLHSLFPDPSDLTLPFALNSASRLPNPLPVGEQLHARSLKLPSHSNPHVLTSLLNLYSKCGLLDHARAVFDEMRCPDTVSWTALITAYMNAGRDREAVATARDAFASGMRPDSVTATRVLTACAQATDLDTGEVAWRAAQREGIAGDVFVATAAVDLYVKCGETAKAREVFDKMPRKDAVAWGTMIRGYTSNGHPREAVEIYFAMQSQGVRPECYTVAYALSACSRLRALDLGRQAAGVVEWGEFLDDPVLGTALIDMYVKCGSTWDAWSVFQQMRKRDIVVWNKMILRLGMTGHGKTVFALVGQMEKSGMTLNDNIFIGILCSCVHAGLVKDGRRYFRNMIQLYHITPRIEHYGRMVDLFTRAGLLQEARQLIDDMPMQANVVMWRAILGGCKIHRDTELAEHVLKHLILLEPRNSGNYVMLLNIYSNSDRWEDAAKLRLDMKAKGVEKVPCPFGGRRTAWPLLQGVLERTDEEQVRAAARKSVLRTPVRRDSSGLRQVAPVCAVRAGAVGLANHYIFKSRLHEYTQKAGLMTPEYQTLMEGPSHEPIFKSTVVINNVKYESLPGFFTAKAAEQSAAEVALLEIGKSVVLPTNASIPAVQETGLYKDLLQQYAQKMNYAIPSYICNKQASGVGSGGASAWRAWAAARAPTVQLLEALVKKMWSLIGQKLHGLAPLTSCPGSNSEQAPPLGVGPFICTVEIGGIQYIGAAARTEKEAEIKAARTALLAIQGQSEGCANGTTKYIVVPGKRQGKETEKKPIGTPKLLKAKKGGLKKQQNKKKFIKKNGEAVNMGKDEAIVPADTHHSDVPLEPAETTQDPSIDTLMLQPGEGAGRVEHEPTSDTAILQPDGEARKVEQESPSDTAILQAHEEARRVEQEPPIDTPMVLHDEEARSVKQQPLIDTAMPQPQVEDRRDSSKSLPGLKALIIAGGEEQVLAAGRRPVLLTHVQQDSSGLRQVALVRAVRAGTGGEDGQLLRPGVGRFVRAYSWVEFSGKVHEFRVGDKSHPLTDQIYKKLDELGMEMKNMCYKPSTDVVLFDLEDEKEHTLVPYSEKLAIAFGLLSTQPWEAIRVTNNLRVCTDCHTAIKLISRIAHQEIVVQDNSRLHCFRDGCCSCNDHW